MPEFAFGVRKRRFAQLGHDQSVALDANFQATHFLDELLQGIGRGFEALQIFRVGVVIQTASAEQDLKISQRVMNFVDSHAAFGGCGKRDFGNLRRRVGLVSAA
jgi:hypothetical protein